MPIYDDHATIFDAQHVTFDGLIWQRGNVAVGTVSHSVGAVPVSRPSVTATVARGSVESGVTTSTVTVNERP